MKLTYKNHPMQVLGYIKMAGVGLVSVEATDGSEPFVAGLTYPVKTRFGVVRLDELIIDLSDECRCVLPEHSCPYCREISQRKRSVEINYGEMPY